MDGFFNKALAMAIRCFWPPDTVTPLSPKTVSYPSGNVFIKSLALAKMAASFTYREIFSQNKMAATVYVINAYDQTSTAATQFVH